MIGFRQGGTGRRRAERGRHLNPFFARPVPSRVEQGQELAARSGRTTGETLTVKLFAFYALQGGKVASLKTARWPANVGVTPPSAGAGHSPEA